VIRECAGDVVPIRIPSCEMRRVADDDDKQLWNLNK